MEGIIIKSTGSWYTVAYQDGLHINCKIKGSFKIKGIESTNPIAVGDHVHFEHTDEVDVGVIYKIEDRKNYIIRKSINLSKQTHIIAANVDKAFLITTIAQPRTSLGFIDRFLVTAEAYHIPTTLVFNKSDIYTEEEVDLLVSYMATYEEVGYPCLLVSAYNKQSVVALENELSNGINLLSGHSGVGKSTLINALVPQLNLKTGDISSVHSKGKHTTTFAEMFELEQGGYIVDTPGIKELGIVNMKKEEIGDYFPEFRIYKEQCKFNNCLHINEPKCAIKEALAEGEIAVSRYASYLSILNNENED